MYKSILKMRKVAAIAACLAGMTTFTQAQTPVTIDVSTLGGTDASNSGNPTEAQWIYEVSNKRFILMSSNGNYTLTGTNAAFRVYVANTATNASLILNGVDITGTTGEALLIGGDNFTLGLEGVNSLVSTVSAGVYFSTNGNFTITSLIGGHLMVKGENYFAIGSTKNLIISGDAAVIAESTSGTAINVSNNIQMSDNAKLTMKTSTTETHTFEKLDSASTYQWKLTNATTTNLLTDAIIGVTVAAGQSGTVERINTTYDITATAGANGSISPSGNITVNAGTDQTFTFTANSGYEISQVLIDNLNNFPAVAAGTYTFTNVAANHTIEVYFSPITGISEATAEKIQIYPNPTSGQLRVSGDIGNDKDIQVFNVVGQVVFTSPLSKLSPETTIDISGLANGLYFLKVGGKTFKIIKN